MSEIGRYCKAYLASSLRAYPGWKEKPEGLRQLDTAGARRTFLEDDAIVYLHENYHVTDDVFTDEHVIFDDVTEEWREFCTLTLKFKVPDDMSSGCSVPAKAASATE